MLKILITGANGQLGRSFHSLDGVAQAMGMQLQLVDKTVFDITQGEAIDRYLKREKIDVVVNTAAYTAVDLAEDNELAAQQINVSGAENLARACQQNNSKLIHISTDYVFDGEQVQPYAETDEPSPVGVYGVTKLAGEKAVLEYCPQAIILRTSWVFSEYGNNFLKTMLRLAKDKNELNIVADQWGSPTYAPHIAEAVLKIIARGTLQAVPSGIYHFSGGAPTNWSGFAKHIFQSAEQINANFKAPLVQEIPTSAYPTRAVRPKNSSLDCSKIYALLKVAPYTWQEGVIRSISALLD